MKLELTAAAVQELERLPAPARTSVLGVLTTLANNPARLDEFAVSLDGDDADALDLSADAVAAAAGGQLLGISVTQQGGWLSRSRPSIHVYLTTAQQTLAVLAVSTYEPAAVG